MQDVLAQEASAAFNAEETSASPRWREILRDNWPAPSNHAGVMRNKERARDVSDERLLRRWDDYVTTFFWAGKRGWDSRGDLSMNCTSGDSRVPVTTLRAS